MKTPQQTQFPFSYYRTPQGNLTCKRAKSLNTTASNLII